MMCLVRKELGGINAEIKPLLLRYDDNSPALLSLQKRHQIINQTVSLTLPRKF